MWKMTGAYKWVLTMGDHFLEMLYLESSKGSSIYNPGEEANTHTHWHLESGVELH